MEGGSESVKITTSQNLWPRIDSNQFIKNNHSKRSFSFTRNFEENVTLVARRREHFRVFFGDFFGCSTPSKRGISVHKNSRASCQRYNGIVTAYHAL